MLMMCKCVFSYFIKLAFPGSLSLIFMVGICFSRDSANSSPIVQVKFIASWAKKGHCVGPGVHVSQETKALPTVWDKRSS